MAKVCSYGPMGTEGSVKQAMPGGWLVGRSVGWLVGYGLKEKERTLGVGAGVV